MRTSQHGHLPRAILLLFLGWSAMDLDAQDWGRFYQWTLNGVPTRVSGHALQSGKNLMACTQSNSPYEVTVMMCNSTGGPDWVRRCMMDAGMYCNTGEFPNGDPYVLWWTAVPERVLNVVRFDPDGDVVWKRSIPSAFASNSEYGGDAWIVPSGTSGTGRLRILEEMQFQAALLEIGDNGDLLSYRAYDDGTPGYDFFGRSMAVTNDGGTVTCGDVETVPWVENVCVVHRFDAAGALAWCQRLVLDAPYTEAQGIRETNDGGLLMTCGTSVGGELVAVKMFADGAINWARSYLVDPARPYAYRKLLEDANGELLLVGEDEYRRQSALHLSSTGEIIGTVRFENDLYGTSRMLDYDWTAFEEGKVTVAGITSLEPICYFPHTMGMAQFEGPVEQPLACFASTEEVTISTITASRETSFQFSMWPVQVTGAPATFTVSDASATHTDLCTITAEPLSLGSDLGDHGAVDIWPNPASTLVRVQVPSTGHIDVQLFDAQGTNVPVRVTRGNTEWMLHVDELARGLYLLHVNDGVSRTAHRVILR